MDSTPTQQVDAILDEVRKVAERERMLRDETKRKLLDSLTRTAPAIICQIADEQNPQAVIVYATPVLESLFGFVPGWLLEKDIGVLIPVDRHAKHREHLMNYIKDPKPRQMGDSEMELFGRKADGTVVPIETILYPQYVAGCLYVTATIIPLVRHV